MQLTISELAELPLAAALLDRDDTVIAQTPEWQCAGPGTIAYPVRRTRLLIATAEAAPASHALLERLLSSLDAAAGCVYDAGRLRMLAASLRVVAGRRVTTAGTSRDVMESARIGIHARCECDVDVAPDGEVAVAAPEVAALVLVQLAVNAAEHAGATQVTLSNAGSAFHVSWRGAAGRAVVATSRRYSERPRWGMGFARIAADTLGGGVYGPYDSGDGMTVATLELGLGRLALPLASVRGDRVVRATRTWDEETGCPPGSEAHAGSRLRAALDAALRAPGRIAAVDGWCARAGHAVVWIAVPPDDASDRARDVLAGLVHERALTEGLGEPCRSSLTALALLLGASMGTPLPRVPCLPWRRRLTALAGPFELRMAIPDFAGVGAMEPSVVALLAREAGDDFDIDGDHLWLRVRREQRGNPLVTPLLDASTNRIQLA